MRLILHAGTHKTGTTSIQKVLAEHRRGLRGQGLIYPDGGTVFSGTSVPHHRFSHAVTGANSAGIDRAKAFVAEVAASAETDATVLISAEPVYRHIAGYDGWDRFSDPAYWGLRKRYLENMAEVLRPFEVEVVVFLRDVDDFAVSLYHEVVRVKQYWQGSFAEFRSAFAPWFEYDRQVALFREVFADVRVFRYEDALSPGLLPYFFRVLGFTMPAGAEKVWLRRSADTAR